MLDVAPLLDYRDAMRSPFATRLFRIVFVLAGCCNLAFGIWVGFWPLHFFELFELELPRYPEIWACLGMVVGVYGLLYWHAAWKPETGRPIIAIGLLGKVLGPIGMVWSFSESWPLRLAMLNLYNDLLWWLPFALFLLRGTSWGQRLVRLAPWCCAGFHLLGLAVMGLVLRPGTVAQPDLNARVAYIAQHTTAWTAGWAIWMASALSLVAFYAWWGAKLSSARLAFLPQVGVLLAMLGAVCDLSGESISVLLLAESATLTDLAKFEYFERAATLLTAGAANLCYTLGGLLLMLGTPDLPRGVRRAMWGTWIAGVGMTFAAAAGHVGGMAVTTAVLFPLLIGWTIWMGRNWRSL